jgi:hypothetical protein
VKSIDEIPPLLAKVPSSKLAYNASAASSVASLIPARIRVNLYVGID